MSDFESIDNSTDDPDYMSEQSGIICFKSIYFYIIDLNSFSVVSSSSDDFVTPQKPRTKNQTKKKSLMAASKSDSPGATFSLSQVVTDQSQAANVVFKKTFDGKSFLKR